jgi:hypothetical protein
VCSGIGQRGKHITEQTRKKLRISHLGQRAWNKGLLGYLAEEKHSGWKGDGAGRVAIHDWVKRKLGKPNRCDNPKCIYPRQRFNGKLMSKPKRYDWANIDHKYQRKISDWIRLCPSCHKLYDRKKLSL